jgi:hypothetical protein
VKEFRNGALTADVDGTRQAIFEKNLELIKSHNAIPTKTWFATVNKFTDMTNEEFRALNKGRKEKMFEGEAQPHKLSAMVHDIPASKDWRDEAKKSHASEGSRRLWILLGFQCH